MKRLVCVLLLSVMLMPGISQAVARDRIREQGTLHCRLRIKRKDVFTIGTFIVRSGPKMAGIGVWQVRHRPHLRVEVRLHRGERRATKVRSASTNGMKLITCQAV
jgi:hypothetical protein